MIRKMLVIAAAVAMPASALAVGAIGAGTAGAVKGPPPTPVNCYAAGTINFDSPGVSHNGAVDTSKDTTTTTSGITFSQDGSSCASGGSSPANSIVSKATKCTGTNAPEPGCAKGSYSYDTAATFYTSGASNISKALKHVSLTLGSGATAVTYAGTTKASSQIKPGNACGSESGFAITGKIGKNAAGFTAFSLNVCLGTDTGTGLYSAPAGSDGTHGTSFTSDIGDALLNSAATDVIATANIDPATSVLTLS